MLIIDHEHRCGYTWKSYSTGREGYKSCNSECASWGLPTLATYNFQTPQAILTYNTSFERSNQYLFGARSPSRCMILRCIFRKSNNPKISEFLPTVFSRAARKSYLKFPHQSYKKWSLVFFPLNWPGNSFVTIRNPSCYSATEANDEASKGRGTISDYLKKSWHEKIKIH